MLELLSESDAVNSILSSPLKLESGVYIKYGALPVIEPLLGLVYEYVRLSPSLSIDNKVNSIELSSSRTKSILLDIGG